MKNTQRETKRKNAKLATRLENHVRAFALREQRRVQRNEEQLWKLAVLVNNGEFTKAQKLVDKLPMETFDVIPQSVKDHIIKGHIAEWGT